MFTLTTDNNRELMAVCIKQIKCYIVSDLGY